MSKNIKSKDEVITSGESANDVIEVLKLAEEMDRHQKEKEGKK